MCFLPYPSIPPPFSYYSAWIPLERSFGYSYSFQSIEVEQAYLIYSNAQNKKREKEKMSKSDSVNPLAVSMLSNARKAGNTKRGSHQKLLYLLQCSKKSTSIRRTFPTVSTLSNRRKAGEYSDKDEAYH